MIRWLIVLGLMVAAVAAAAMAMLFVSFWWWTVIILMALAAVGAYDLIQRRHSVLRNYPLIGHLRFMFEATIGTVVDAVRAAYAGGARTVLVSSTAALDQRGEAAPGTADRLERAAGEVARAAVTELGVRRLLVAGGETSGAVVRALGLVALRVGPPAGTGVPWLVPAEDDALALLLKSGNFGTVDLFTTAWEECP